MKVGLIVGSLRKKSWNRKVAEVAQTMFPADFEVEFIDISQLPFYNEDLDGEDGLPIYQEMRAEIRKYDAYLFFTPEYNRSYAPAAKNLLDVGSKDPNGNPWSGKPVAVFSASPGAYGGMGANFALRQVLVNLNLIPLQRPEVYLSKVHTLFDENGEMVEDTKKFLQKAVDAFVEHAKRFAN